MKRTLRFALTLLVTALGAASLTGCTGTANQNDGRIHVVSSLAVWADIARSIGGNQVSATSLINSPNQDPHSYEATAQDQLAVDRADIVIYSGNGYDAFMTRLLDAGHIQDSKIIDLHNLELTVFGESTEQHQWMDKTFAAYLVQQLADKLGTQDPKHKADFDSRVSLFTDKLQKTFGALEIPPNLRNPFNFIATEPIASGFLIRYYKFKDVTPPAMVQAAINGQDLSPTTMYEVRNLIKRGQSAVNLLVYNEQVRSAQTDQLIAQAEKSGIATLGFSETLPKGITYLQWIEDTKGRLSVVLDNLAKQ
jgi:zinc/manganese transport system substrate-binding protein